MKIVASGPLSSWQIDGETMETVKDFTFMGSKINQILCLEKNQRGHKQMEKYTVFMDWKNQDGQNGYTTQSNL